jgi:hypothetical protein
LGKLLIKQRISGAYLKRIAVIGYFLKLRYRWGVGIASVKETHIRGTAKFIIQHCEGQHIQKTFGKGRYGRKKRFVL